MTVAQLIEELQKMPPYAQVFIEREITPDYDPSTYQSSPMLVRWEGNHVEIE